MTHTTTLRSKRGFTLMELLIAVALIGILVAIAIPVFSGALEKLREETDAKYEAQAQALGAAYYLLEKNGATLNFDPSFGKLVSAVPSAAYGEGTAAGDVAEDHRDKFIQVTIGEDGAVTFLWTKGGLTSTSNETAPDKAFIDAIPTENPQYSFSSIDSTAPDENAVGSKSYKIQLLEKLGAAGIDIDDFNIGSWSVRYEAKPNAVLWWSDVDISKLYTGDKVRVIRYNQKLGTYTAGYMTVELSDELNGVQYNIFTGGTNKANWSEYTSQTQGKQSNTSKLSYDETLSFFNEMDPVISNY